MKMSNITTRQYMLSMRVLMIWMSILSVCVCVWGGGLSSAKAHNNSLDIDTSGLCLAKSYIA